MIRLDGVAKFHGEKPVLRNLTCSFYSGQVSLVAGPNGAGKSTLLQMIAGLARPTFGRIEKRDGTKIGYLGHSTFVYDNLTALENLDFWNRADGLGLTAAELAARLGKVGLGRHANERARVFSRGMAQRLALARVMLSDPDLLLLDEPGTGLDAGAHGLLREEIHTARGRKKCVVMVSHDLDCDKAIADRLLVLGNGKIIYDGPPSGYIGNDAREKCATHVRQPDQTCRDCNA